MLDVFRYMRLWTKDPELDEKVLVKNELEGMLTCRCATGSTLVGEERNWEEFEGPETVSCGREKEGVG